LDFSSSMHCLLEPATDRSGRLPDAEVNHRQADVTRAPKADRPALRPSSTIGVKVRVFTCLT